MGVRKDAEHEGELVGHRGYERERETERVRIRVREAALHEKRVKERRRDGNKKGRMGVGRDKMCMRKGGAQGEIIFNLLVKLSRIYDI